MADDLGALLSSGGADHGGALSAKFKCNGLSDTATGPGYECYLILQCQSPILR